MSKLQILCESEGFADPLDMLEEFQLDGAVPGICKNPDCTYSTHVEPDSESGWCEACNTNTVVSAMVLAGII